MSHDTDRRNVFHWIQGPVLTEAGRNTNNVQEDAVRLYIRRLEEDSRMSSSFGGKVDCSKRKR